MVVWSLSSLPTRNDYALSALTEQDINIGCYISTMKQSFFYLASVGHACFIAYENNLEQDREKAAVALGVSLGHQLHCLKERLNDLPNAHGTPSRQ